MNKRNDYEPPTITVLGTVTDFTRADAWEIDQMLGKKPGKGGGGGNGGGPPTS